MSLNIDMEKKIKESQGLKRTLVNESLTKKVKQLQLKIKLTVIGFIVNFIIIFVEQFKKNI